MNTHAVEQENRLETLTRQIRLIRALPLFPETLAALNQLYDDGAVSAESLTQVIQQDPFAVVIILAKANHKRIVYDQTVNSIAMACEILGLKEIHDILNECEVIDYSKIFQYNRIRKLKKNAVVVATIAQCIAQFTDEQSHGTIYATGLLHNIGRIVIELLEEDVDKKTPTDLKGEDLLEAELEYYGMNYKTSSYLVCSSWGLPDVLLDPIRNHRQNLDTTELSDSESILTLSVLLSEVYGSLKPHTIVPFVRSVKPHLINLKLSTGQFVILIRIAGKFVKEELKYEKLIDKAIQDSLDAIQVEESTDSALPAKYEQPAPSPQPYKIAQPSQEPSKPRSSQPAGRAVPYDPFKTNLKQNKESLRPFHDTLLRREKKEARELWLRRRERMLNPSVIDLIILRLPNQYDNIVLKKLQLYWYVPLLLIGFFLLLSLTRGETSDSEVIASTPEEQPVSSSTIELTHFDEVEYIPKRSFEQTPKDRTKFRINSYLQSIDENLIESEIPYTYWRIANLHYSVLQDYEEAEKYYHLLISTYPEWDKIDQIYESLIDCYRQLDDSYNEKKTYKEMIERFPEKERPQSG